MDKKKKDREVMFKRIDQLFALIKFVITLAVATISGTIALIVKGVFTTQILILIGMGFGTFSAFLLLLAILFYFNNKKLNEIENLKEDENE